MKISVNELLLSIGFLLLSTMSWAQTRVLTNQKGEKYTEFEYKTPNQSTSKNKYKGSIFWQDSLAMGTFSVAGGETLTKPVLPTYCINVLLRTLMISRCQSIIPMQRLALRRFVVSRGVFTKPFLMGK